MSLVVSILFVLGLFGVLGFVAWVAVLYALTSPRAAGSRPLVFDASLHESRETQYAA